MPNPLLEKLQHDARHIRDDMRWSLLINLEIMLFNTPWWKLERQYKLRKLIRIYRKGIRK